MTQSQKTEVTQLLQAWGHGDSAALERLTPLVYQELHRLAQRCMAREAAGHSLQASALVNEAYLRLVDIRRVEWQDRAHFFAVSARMMRRILTDFARSRHNLKHGRDMRRVSWDDGLVIVRRNEADILAVDEALKELAHLDERKAQVVELRFFGGLNVEETAEALSISPETVMRDWKFSKAWLQRTLEGEKGCAS